MFVFKPAPDSIARCLERFRADILLNNFKISEHANLRIRQRGFTMEDVKRVVKHGCLGTGAFIQDKIGGCFHYDHTVIYVYAPYGDRAAFPVIVTMFRDSETYTPPLEELIQKSKVEIKEIVKTVEIVRGVDSLSVTDIEALLNRRRKEQDAETLRLAEANRQRLERELSATDKQLAELTTRRGSLQTELHDALRVIDAAPPEQFNSGAS